MAAVAEESQSPMSRRVRRAKPEYGTNMQVQ
jgi:hypothetical protein